MSTSSPTWAGRFIVESFGVDPQPVAHRAFVQHYLRAAARFVLWTQAGRPVSMAMVRMPAAGASRIGPVYTPDAERGNGYGSVVTAAASEGAMAMGADHVVLFTDLANPVSNAIYQRIGFEPVSVCVTIALSAGDGGPRTLNTCPRPRPRPRTVRRGG